MPKPTISRPKAVALCLRRDPARRLRAAGDARILIEEIRAGKSGDAPMQQSSSKESTVKGIVLLVATAALVLIAGVLAGRTIRQEPTRELPLRKFTIPLSVADSSSVFLSGPKISPDGKRVLYPSRRGLWVRDLDDTEARILVGTEGASKPFWSHDSEWIGFERGQGLEKVRRSGGEPTPIAVLPDQIRSVRAPSWGEDDQIVFGPGTRGLHAVSANGGDFVEVVPTVEGESDYHEADHLPGGRGWIIVVHRVEQGYGTLGVFTPEGDRRYLLSLEGVTIANPSYSPTGHIVYWRGGQAEGIWAFPFSLERLERTGEPFRVISGGHDPSVADDGTLSCVRGIGSRRSRLVWFDRSGERMEPIGEPLDNLYPFPAVSKDGQSVLITGGRASTREVFVVDVASGVRRQLTFGGLLHDQAVWHPDGKRVVSVLNRLWALHVTSIDGSASDGVMGEGSTPEYTADGSRLLFAGNAPDRLNQDIYWRATEAEHDTAEMFVGGPGVQQSPSASPDGRHVAYTSDESGRTEVYLTTFPKPARIWQVSTTGGQYPQWRADGRELFFANRDAIYAHDVNPDNGTPSGAPRLLFRRPVTGWKRGWSDGFHVTADGQRFLVTENVRAEDAPDRAIVVVQNWFAPFETED